MHKHQGHTRNQRHGIARCFRLSITAALTFIALSGLLRFWSFLQPFSHPPGIAEIRSIGTPPFSSPSARETLIASRIADLQAMVGRSMQAIQEGDPVSNCTSWLAEERSNHSHFLVQIVAYLDNVLDILQYDRNDTHITNTGNPTEEKKQLEEEEAPEEEEEKSLLFKSEELRKYMEPKQNRGGRKNFMGSTAAYPSVGAGCLSRAIRVEAEQYMAYEVAGRCPDDWAAAQRLMLQGCDPPPRRRCLAAAHRSSDYRAPLALPASLWSPPPDRSLLWTHYKCKSFGCLGNKSSTPGAKGFYKCGECFDLEGHETRRWRAESNNTAEFSLERVLGLKAPGEIRIGVDFGPGTGTFAAMMRERNVTIAIATLNLGAPFNEMIALRGLIPLYVSVNQRLPFFDNTLDIVHTTLFLDGWIDVEFLEFVVFDWDRVLRPGGLLWIDRFFCAQPHLQQYLQVFQKLPYARLLWSVEPKVDKDGGEVFFSAILEKTVKP